MKRLCILLVFFVASPSLADDAFRAGFAERDITPKIGMEQPGGYGKSYHRSIHDACKVRACVFDDGSQTVALVGLDALFIHNDTTSKVRQGIHAKTGIAESAILIGASHSHSSGPMSGVMPGEYDDSPEWIQKLAYEHSTCADAEYLAHAETQIIDAVVAAFEARVPVQCGVSSGTEDQVAFNRRFRMRSGYTMTHPRQGNPDILEVAGPTDPEVGVIGVWNGEGKLLGCVVNFACHATTSPGGASANYIHYLEKVIQGYYGKETVVVFLNGMSGDVTQVDNLSPELGRRGEESAAFVGGRVGAEALKQLLTMPRGAFENVGAKEETLAVKHRPPSKERLERCTKIAQQDPKTVDRTEWTFAKEIVLLGEQIKKSATKEVRVQAVQVGPVMFVTSPAEYFCEYGLEIKKQSQHPFTFPVSLANGCVGYVPTKEAFGERGGGYETRLTSYSNLVITAGDRIRDKGIELANGFTPNKPPVRAKAPKFQGGAWSYGSLPPELD